jgi:hypothetical protein
MRKNFLGIGTIYVVIYIIFVVTDVWTTHYAFSENGMSAHGMKLTELNQFTDTKDVSGMIISELIVFICLFTAFIIGHLKLSPIAKRNPRSPKQFFREASTGISILWIALVIISLEINVMRIIPVINNSCLLSFGWSPTSWFLKGMSATFGMPIQKVYFVSLSITFGLLAMPILYGYHNLLQLPEGIIKRRCDKWNIP